MVTRSFQTGKLFRTIQAFVHTHTHTRKGVDDIARMSYEELEHELVKVEGDITHLTHRFAAIQARRHDHELTFDLMHCYVGVVYNATDIMDQVAAFAKKEGNS